MLRSSTVTLCAWRTRYHNTRLPRMYALRLHKEKLVAAKEAEKRSAAAAAAAAAATGSSSGKNNSKKNSSLVPQHTYRYNKYHVSHELDFIAQVDVVEEESVVEDRKQNLTREPTPEKIWRTSHKPYMEPLVPFIRVLDYPKDPDVKSLKPTNIPRWKDFMFRKKPMVPRTWY